MPDQKEKFRDRLVRLRKKQGYTQAELSRLVGISRRAMCYYERESKGLPPSAILIKLAQALNVSMEELVGMEQRQDGRTLEARTMKKLQHVADLPAEDRKMVLDMVDLLLKKNTGS